MLFYIGIFPHKNRMLIHISIASLSLGFRGKFTWTGVLEPTLELLPLVRQECSVVVRSTMTDTFEVFKEVLPKIY